MSFNSVNNNKNMDVNLYRKQVLDELAKMTDEEKIALFSKNVAVMLAKKAEYDVPENGQFAKSELTFDIPSTQNEAHFYITYELN